MAIVEIQLNRLGINSLELSTDSIDVSAGTSLHIRITNFGAPTHATLRTDGAAYTNFTYENLYVEAEAEIKIPILENASQGNFEMQVISGYGMRRTAFTINVIIPQPVCSEPEPITDSAKPQSTKQKFKTEKNTAHLTAGGNSALFIVNAIAPILGFILLILWIIFPDNVNNILMASIIYIIMLIGILIAWRTAQ